MPRDVDFSRPTNDSKEFDNLMAMTAEGQLKKLLYTTATINPASAADGVGVTASVTVTGAELGDFVLASAPYDLVDVTVSAYVQAANTVEIRIQNESTSTVDLASGTWRILVLDVT